MKKNRGRLIKTLKVICVMVSFAVLCYGYSNLVKIKLTLDLEYLHRYIFITILASTLFFQSILWLLFKNMASIGSFGFFLLTFMLIVVKNTNDMALSEMKKNGSYIASCVITEKSITPYDQMTLSYKVLKNNELSSSSIGSKEIYKSIRKTDTILVRFSYKYKHEDMIFNIKPTSNQIKLCKDGLDYEDRHLLYSVSN
jgi:hypothetical protein